MGYRINKQKVQQAQVQLIKLEMALLEGQENDLVKGIKGPHKYRARWFKNGRWEYDYGKGKKKYVKARKAATTPNDSQPKKVMKKLSIHERRKLLRVPSHEELVQNLLEGKSAASGSCGSFFIHPEDPGVGVKYASLMGPVEIESTRIAGEIGVGPRLYKGNSEHGEKARKRANKGERPKTPPDFDSKENIVMSSLFAPGYLVIENLSGYETLKDMTDEPAKDKYRLQAIGHINTLHKAGYSHHDVHDDNIMANPETGDVKLIDFGLAGKGNIPILEELLDDLDNHYLAQLKQLPSPVLRTGVQASPRTTWMNTTKPSVKKRVIFQRKKQKDCWTAIFKISK